MRPCGGPAPSTIRLLAGTQPSRCGTTARTAAGEPTLTVRGGVDGVDGFCGVLGWPGCGRLRPAGRFLVMGPGLPGRLARGAGAMSGLWKGEGAYTGRRGALTA